MAIDGAWDMVMQSPLGARNVKANFVSAAGALSGTFEAEQGSAPVSGTADGDSVSFGASIVGPMGPMELKFSGQVVGDGISGSVNFGGFASGTFTGTRA